MTFSTNGSGSIPGGLVPATSLKININSVSSSSSTNRNNDPAALADLPSTKTRYVGQGLDLSNAKNATDIAKEAINSISELRKQQLSIADEAANTSEGSRLSTLNNAFKTAQTEIDRITNSATYNGTNVLTSPQTYTFQSTNKAGEDVQNAVSLPDVSSAVSFSAATGSSSTTSTSNAFSTQAGAITVYNNLSTNITAVFDLNSSVSSASDKAATLIQQASTERIQDPLVAPKTEPDAADLAKKIAEQITSPYSSDLAKQQLIEASTQNLNPDKVSSLLQPPK